MADKIDGSWEMAPSNPVDDINDALRLYRDRPGRCTQTVGYLRGTTGDVVSFVCKHAMAPGQTTCECCSPLARPDGSCSGASGGVVVAETVAVEKMKKSSG